VVGILRRCHGFVVAQSRANSPEAIYAALTGDTAFMALVGDRTFSGNTTSTKAISIVTPGAPLPALKSQVGLEVVIHDSGTITRKDYLTNSPDTMVMWQVFLIAWPPASGATMTDAARRAMEIFGGATAIQTVPTPEGLNSLVQTLINIPEGSAILD
jgi:hypothetical protein